jgi:sigma-B regulation protein RsbU (phosphoserine phosphatase)
MRKVLLPINVKLNIFLIVLLVSSLTFYVFYAVDLFEKDKSAYVFETIKAQNDSISSSFDEKIQYAFKQVELILRLSYSTRLTKYVFDENPMLNAYYEWRGQANVKSIIDESLDEKIQISWESYKEQVLQLKEKSGVKVINLVDQPYVMVWQEFSNSQALVLLDGMYLKNTVSKGRLFQHYLQVKNTPWTALATEDSLDLTGISDKIGQMQVEQGTFIAEIDNKKWIVSFKQILNQITVLTMVEQDKALEATAYLKRQSIYFGVLVLALAILFGFLFAKVFTRPISRLYQASREFAKQQFQHRVTIASKDELGVLADSFNTMAEDIVTYMGEMEEKNRLENELKTAQLVQNSFFPVKTLNENWYKLHSYYKPATECGGDWWGFLQKDNKLVLILIDATGHGTAAALITAVVHNCLTALEYLIERDPSYLNSSSLIMKYLNHSVCNVRSSLMATAFVAVIDQDKNEITYTNASHNPPLIVNSHKETIDKSDIHPLIEALGKRLGEDFEAEYEESSIGFQVGDRILCYTDGLIEGENQQGKQWGKRKLIKSILELKDRDIEASVDAIVDSAFAFYDGKAPDDDISVVGVDFQ